MPPKAISYLIYSGRQVGPDEALVMGMVSRVFAASDFTAEYDKLLLEMTGRPRAVLQTIKQYERKARDLSADMARDYAGTLLALAQTEIKKPAAASGGGTDR